MKVIVHEVAVRTAAGPKHDLRVEEETIFPISPESFEFFSEFLPSFIELSLNEDNEIEWNSGLYRTVNNDPYLIHNPKGAETILRVDSVLQSTVQNLNFNRITHIELITTINDIYLNG